MSQPDIIKALGPGSQLSDLGKATTAYDTATETFNALLQYPSLQSIVLVKEGEDDNQDLRTILTNGLAQFHQLRTKNVSVAQQVDTFGRMVPTLLKAVPVNNYATSIASLVVKYGAVSQAGSNESHRFFANFRSYLELLGQQIGVIEIKLDGLTEKIEEANIELTNANVGRVISDIINALFNIAPSADSDDQTATLLHIGIDSLKPSFAQLWKDQQQVQDVIKGLNVLKDNLSAIKTLLLTLSDVLSTVISDTQSLVTIWEDVQKRAEIVKDVERAVTDEESQALTKDWQVAQAATTGYANTISHSTSYTVDRSPLSKQEAVRASGITQSYNPFQSDGYQQIYLNLRELALPGAKKLLHLSEIQLEWIPHLVSSNTGTSPQPGQIPLKTYFVQFQELTEARADLVQVVFGQLKAITPYSRDVDPYPTAIFHSASSDLNDVQAYNNLLRSNDQQPLLEAVRPELITRWKGVQDAMRKYIGLVAK